MADRRPRKAPAKTTHQVQAVVEGVAADVDDDGKVEFFGRQFMMAEKIGLMPLMHLAVAGKRGVDAGDMEGLVALYEVLADCIDQERPQEPDPDNPGETRDAGRSEWDRFQDHATVNKAGGDDLQEVVKAVIQKLSARPSQPPGDLSTGRRTTSGNSKASSSKTAGSDDGMTSVEDFLGR